MTTTYTERPIGRTDWRARCTCGWVATSWFPRMDDAATHAARHELDRHPRQALAVLAAAVRDLHAHPDRLQVSCHRAADVIDAATALMDRLPTSDPHEENH